MVVTIGHKGEKILILKQNQEAEVEHLKGTYPEGTIFDTIEIDTIPIPNTGEELVFRNNTLEIDVMVDTTDVDIVENALKRGIIAEVEVGFARLVTQTLDASAALPTLEDRRVTSKALNAQFQIYNLFQTSVGLGIIPGISTGAIDSIQLALSYLKMLSTAMDDITQEIMTTGVKPPRGKIFENMLIEKGSLSTDDLANRCSQLSIDVAAITI